MVAAGLQPGKEGERQVSLVKNRWEDQFMELGGFLELFSVKS